MGFLMKKKALAGVLITLIGFILSLLFHVSGVVEFLELKTLDTRLQLSDRNTGASDQIAVVMLDEASLQSMQPLVGRWPWPRSLFADLIDFLSGAGAKAILFDILYTEPQVARTPEGELGEDDFALANSTAESGIVIHAAQFLEDKEDEKNKSILNRPLADIYIENNAIKNFNLKKGARTKSANNYYVPLPELYSTARSVGIVEFGADGDGVYRR
ncbi:MAG: CHASE2 domain-containing protein, partial [Proteobacteria bacterium]|nr:CHASE2 domain-containing protein [Pseudomonadota bacterium]